MVNNTGDHRKRKDEIPSSIAQYILEMWQKIDKRTRPWGVWISANLPVNPTALEIKTPAFQAWFLDKTGYHSRSIWDYARFYTIHFDPIFSPRSNKLSDGVFQNKYWELGLARFANILGSDEFIVETIFAGLLGEGVRLELKSDNTFEIKGKVWIS